MKSTILTVVSLCLFAAFLPGALRAETEGRFTMMPSGDGFVRLDTQTGAVSLCKTENAQLVCELTPDGEERYKDEIEGLKAENKKLKAEIDRLEQHFGLKPGGTPNDLLPPSPPQGRLQVPTEEDLDKMFDYIEGMLKKFRKRFKKLEEEQGEEVPL